MNGGAFMWPTLEVCAKRGRKGLYGKARAGLIKDFTGIPDPYEPPNDAEIVIVTSKLTPEEATGIVLDYLNQEGWLATLTDIP